MDDTDGDERDGFGLMKGAAEEDAIVSMKNPAAVAFEIEINAHDEGKQVAAASISAEVHEGS